MELNLNDAFIERCNKETEEVITQEQPSFLSTPITFLKQHREEFVYIESPEFEAYKTDAISIELDDVFNIYMALLGFKVQKKHTSAIKTFLSEQLQGENQYFSASFSGDEGLWELNIPIEGIKGFNENLTISEVLVSTIGFLQSLLDYLEQ
nr:protoporphyrinogen oxidase [Lysinibacillus timonensis]